MRRGAGVVAVLVTALVAMAVVPAVDAQPASVAGALDARIQKLVDLRILRGAPDGDLELDRVANGGEYVVMLERVLAQPKVASQQLRAFEPGTESTGWLRFYAWTTSAWARLRGVGTSIRHVWFDYWGYHGTDQTGWGIERSHWMFPSLRNAYLDDQLIDLSFDPMAGMDGTRAIELMLTAAGFGGEVASVRAQMDDTATGDPLLIVCRQHGLDAVMEYAGQPLTRRAAALLTWRLLALRTAAD